MARDYAGYIAGHHGGGSKAFSRNIVWIGTRLAAGGRMRRTKKKGKGMKMTGSTLRRLSLEGDASDALSITDTEGAL